MFITFLLSFYRAVFVLIKKLIINFSLTPL